RELGAVRDRDVQLQALIAERDEASADERAGIDRLLGRIERERAAARSEMIEFLRDLDDRGVAEETARHFGPTFPEAESDAPPAPLGNE
ncbi:MAG TPA: CHAD domain-containing protein, partial [Thermomicrobiales bacterium]|nr:CHAD domain-containing protein [Thermomicrobiales bacterium]